MFTLQLANRELSIAWQSYKSLAVTLVNTPDMFRSVLMENYHMITAEMKDLSSDRSDSILRNNVEAVKWFHWDSADLF